MTAPIKIGLGTEKSNVAPWQSYDKTMDRLDGASDRLKAAVQAYAQKRHEKQTNAGKEEMQRQLEMSCDSVKSYKWDEQDELVTELDRIGHVMNCLEFVKRVNKYIPIGFGNASANKGLMGLTVRVPTEHGGEWTYAGTIQLGYNHEYSTIWLDKHNLPLNEKWRGWRTVLLRLVQGGFLTERQALQEFGEPVTGPVSRRYRAQMYGLRNRQQKYYDTDGNKA